jgi:hypothetical protein
MSALTRHLALVSESKRVGIGDVMRVAAALQKQAIRDLARIWEVSATVDAFERLEHVPVGYWPMIIRDDIKQQGAAGIHLDRNRQPFALITAANNLNEWSLTASHEALEMLVDPFGDRLVAGDSPAQGQGRVEFLVEVADPSEGASFGYTVNQILLSDFYTPQYFDPVRAPGVRYSFTGAIRRPREVLRGGYLSWHDPVSDNWFQLTFFGGTGPRVRNIGKLDAKKSSLRSQIDRFTEEARGEASGSAAAEAMVQSGAAAMLTGAQNGDNSSAAADRLRAQIKEIVGAKGKASKSGPGISGGRMAQGFDDDEEGDEPESGLKSGPKYPIEQ